jgi:predicted  nucleic acid-binding Zn-ribbon protein
MPNTEEARNAMQRELDLLAKARDELRVRLHLAKADALDEWKKLEASWQRAQEELRRTSEHTKEPVKEMGAAVRHLMDELKAGYTRIREQLKETPH